MKTYFIKDDETKTAMDYLRGTDVICCLKAEHATK